MGPRSCTFDDTTNDDWSSPWIPYTLAEPWEATVPPGRRRAIVDETGDAFLQFLRPNVFMESQQKLAGFPFVGLRKVLLTGSEATRPQFPKYVGIGFVIPVWEPRKKGPRPMGLEPTPSRGSSAYWSAAEPALLYYIPGSLLWVPNPTNISASSMNFHCETVAGWGQNEMIARDARAHESATPTLAKPIPCSAKRVTF